VARLITVIFPPNLCAGEPPLMGSLQVLSFQIYTSLYIRIVFWLQIRKYIFNCSDKSCLSCYVPTVFYFLQRRRKGNINFTAMCQWETFDVLCFVCLCYFQTQYNTLAIPNSLTTSH